MNKCFAYKNPEGKEGFICTALNTNVCPGKACRFYKTEKQCSEEKKRTAGRLESLPEERQMQIKKKYGI